MATGKKFYWIKLKDSFMTSDKVDYLMSLKDGANYVVLYQILCLKTMNTNGILARQIGEMIIPFDAEKIQRDCKWFSIDTVKNAMIYYTKLGMIYQQEDSLFRIAEYDNIIGSESDYAKQKRNQRKMLNNNSVDNSVDNVHIEIRDKRLEIDNRDKEKDIKKKDKESFASLVSGFSDDPSLLEALNAFVEMRKKIKGGFTVYAMKLALNKLRTLSNDPGEQAEIVNTAVMNGWKSFYELKRESKPNQSILDEIFEPATKPILKELEYQERSAEEIDADLEKEIAEYNARLGWN